MDVSELAWRVVEVPRWYHTLDLAPGVSTPGFYDLRQAVSRLPIPDLTGQHCLDVATFDGFYAFEMERRGAEHVVAIDLDDAVDLDWLPRMVPKDFRRGDEPMGAGFLLAHEELNSKVERLHKSVYDLDRRELGGFGFVICGALMQHLRDPLGALMAIRGVCDGLFLSVELISHTLTLAHPRRPVVELRGGSRTWTMANRAGHLHMLRMAGFDVLEHRTVSVPFGEGGPELRGPRHTAVRVVNRLLGQTTDRPFGVALCRPAGGLHRVPE